MNLGGPLRYLIGADGTPSGRDGEVTEVGYDATEPPAHGIGIAYANLFLENFADMTAAQRANYGPYLHTSDTAAEYNEGQIDPAGLGWTRNLNEQFSRRQAQGFVYIELDNPDAYNVADVFGAIQIAATYGLKVIAKNPGLLERGALAYVAHPNVYGIIVERDAGEPVEMDGLRRKAAKPDMPVWFVAFGSGRKWAQTIASDAKAFRGMGVTYSSEGEYGNSIDILRPIP